jgi:hypothetical protein
MRFKDILLAITILLTFQLCYFVSYIISSYSEIKNNWVKYRCDPVVMPFASFFGHDTGKNFATCIGSLQSSNMAHFVGPINASHSVSNANSKQTGSTMGSFRSLQSKTRNATGLQFVNIFGIFNNLIIQMQKITFTMRDLMLKILGSLTVIMHMMTGQFMLGGSVSNSALPTTSQQLVKGVNSM